MLEINIPKEHLIGSIREIRPGHYQLIFSHKGEKFFLADGLNSENKAILLQARITSQISRGVFDPAEYKKNFYRFEKMVETWLKSSTCSIESFEAKKGVCNNFLIPFFKGKDIRSIKSIDITNFDVHLKSLKTKTGKPFSDKYRWNIMCELKGFLNFPPVKELIPKALIFPKIKFQVPPIRWLTAQQQDEVFEFIPEYDLPIFTFLRWTGARPNEAAGLLRENVFLKADPPHVVLATAMGAKGHLKNNTKTKIAKPLPIIPEIEWTLHPKVISKFVFTRNGHSYSKWMLQKAWFKASTKANKKYSTPHLPLYQGVKHSFGCQRLNSGFSIHQVQSVMGHTSSRTTERYAKYSIDSLSKVMRGNVQPMFNSLSEKQVIEMIGSTELGGKDSNLG